MAHTRMNVNMAHVLLHHGVSVSRQMCKIHETVCAESCRALFQKIAEAAEAEWKASLLFCNRFAKVEVLAGHLGHSWLKWRTL